MPLVLSDVREKVGVITLNRPEKRNAMSAEMFDLFNTAIKQHQANDDVGAILIVANGSAFCAGGDLGMINDALKGNIDANDLDLEFLQPGLIGKPVVCGVVGPCVGEGFAMALASDVVVCGQNAKFSLPEVVLGIPPVDIPLLSARRLSANHILEALWTGDWKNAVWAEKVGLVNTVVPDDEVWQASYALACKIAKAPAASAALVKTLVYDSREATNLVELRKRGAETRAIIRQHAETI